jgi:hypothetical protein
MQALRALALQQQVSGAQGCGVAWRTSGAETIGNPQLLHGAQPYQQW